MERESFKLFKEYSETAIVDKKELYATNFEELHTFLSVRGDFFFFGSQNQESGVLKNFQAAEGLYGKRNHVFDGNLCW